MNFTEARTPAVAGHEDLSHEVDDVIAAFNDSGRVRSEAIREVVTFCHDVASENAAIRDDFARLRADFELSERRRIEAEGERDAARREYCEMAESYSAMFEAVRARMSDLFDEDQMIDAVRRLAYTRATYGVGVDAAPTAVKVGNVVEVAPAPGLRHPVVESGDGDSAIDDKLKLALSNFGRISSRS